MKQTSSFGAFFLAAVAIIVSIAGVAVWGSRVTTTPTFLAQATPPPGGEATFNLVASSNSISVGGTITIDLRIDATAGVTTTRAYIDFNPAIINVVSIDSTGSVFPFEFEETSDNGIGRIQLQRAESTPGFQGTNGLIATITLRGVASGTSAFAYNTVSLALKSDDTDILNIADSTTTSITVSGVDVIPPTRSSGVPSGILSVGTESTLISLSTNENATCKHSTTPGMTYLAMPNVFTTTGGTTHSATVSGLSDGEDYSYHVKCEDLLGNKNVNDFDIEFSIDNSSSSPSPSPGSSPSPSPGPSSSPSSSILGDCNSDARVDVFDFSILLVNWDTLGSVCDLNNDGIRDVFDFSVMLANWTD